MRRDISYMGEKVPSRSCNKKIKNKCEEKIEMKQTKMRQKQKCALLTKPCERTCGDSHTRKAIIESNVKN
jgi:hypothetical protein